jgi:glucan biosynthesis protein C
LDHPATARRAEFDWLRVLALAMLMIFHSAVGYSSWPWQVNDPHNSAALDNFLDFLLRWRVSLVFIVSGSALMLALGRRRPLAILRERGARLLIPLVFGVLVIVPPQVYLGRLQEGKFHGSFIEYLPQAYVGIYPDGNFTWNRLWFIPYVLVLTAAALPLFDWLRTPQARRRIDGAMQAAARYHLYWLLLFPLFGADLLLRGQDNDAHDFFSDLHGWIEFATLFLLGGALAQWPEILQAVQRLRFRALAIGIIAYASLRLIWPAIGENPGTLPTGQSIAWCAISAANQLAWILTAVGFLTHHFNRPSPALTYLTEAAMPVYVLHQTLIVYAVYHLHHVNWPLDAKITITGSFATLGALGLYEVAIRRSKWLRILFGVKPRARALGPELLMPEAAPAPTSRSTGRSS